MDTSYENIAFEETYNLFVFKTSADVVSDKDVFEN